MRLAASGGDSSTDTPRRGFRRVEWIERALAPARKRLTRSRYQRLVSGLCLLVGWEAFIVLRDVRGASASEAEEVSVIAARALVSAALARSAG
jgi:hypothetical protein